MTTNLQPGDLICIHAWIAAGRTYDIPHVSSQDLGLTANDITKHIVRRIHKNDIVVVVATCQTSSNPDTETGDVTCTTCVQVLHPTGQRGWIRTLYVRKV